MEEDDVRFGELLAGLLGDADVDVLVKGSIDESNVVGTDYLGEFFSCAGEFLGGALCTLEANLNAIVILVEFNL